MTTTHRSLCRPASAIPALAFVAAVTALLFPIASANAQDSGKNSKIANPPPGAEPTDVPDEASDPSPGTVERREQGALVLENIPQIPDRITDRLYQYQSTRFASLESWDADGAGMLIRTRFEDTTQVHHVDMPMGARTQVTFFPEPVRAAAARPSRAFETFVFQKDIGGNELYQLFYFDRDDGSVDMLTNGESRNLGVEWSNAGGHMAYSSTERNGKDYDIWVMNPDFPDERELVYEADGAWFVGGWAPGDRHLMLFEYISINDSRIYVLDLETGGVERVATEGEGISVGGVAFGRTPSEIFYTSDEGTEFLELRRLDRETGENTILTEDIPWDVERLAVSPSRETLAFTTNEDGIARLYLLDVESLERTPVGDVPPGQIYDLRWSPIADRLGFVINTARTPGDIYSLDADAAKRGEIELTRWTQSEVGGLDTSDFALPELIRYPTFDTLEDGTQRTIPAFVFEPAGEGPHPVVVSIHGGPESQFLPYFSPLRQYLVQEMGIAVVAPNVRGSAGYGKTYLKLDNAMLREDSVKDIGSLLDWIAQNPELDQDRVAVMGGSYGGYMVLASMIHYGDRLAAGIEAVGISNFVTFLQNTKEYRRDLRRAEYGDERDPEMRAFLEKISPTARADEIDKPMFVAQGANDPRVPASEAEQIVAAIREAGGDAWYMLATDEGHGFRKKTNRDFYMNAVVLFLETHLVPEAPAGSTNAPSVDGEARSADAATKTHR